MRKIVLFLLVVMTLPAVCILAAPFPTCTLTVPLRVAWLGNPMRDERLLKVIDIYQQRFPTVSVHLETVSWGWYWDRINKQMAVNNLPDVIQHDFTRLQQFVNLNLMADLTPFVKSKAINLEGVEESYLSEGRVEGKLYGLSLGIHAVALVYDPAVLQKAGVAEPKPDWTWSDFEKIARQVYAATKVQTLPFLTADPKVGFENWIRQTGRPLFAPDGKSLGFTDPAPLEEFLAIQLRLIKAGALVNPQIAFLSRNPKEDPFSRGNSWVQYVWSDQVVTTQAVSNRPIKVTLLPKIANSQRPGTYLKSSMFLGIPATLKIPARAAQFINYFLTDLDANKVLLGERGVPIIPAVRDKVKNCLDPNMKMVFDFIELVGRGNASPIDPPDPAGEGEVLRMLQDTTQEVLNGKLSAKDGAAKILKQANEILSKI